MELCGASIAKYTFDMCTLSNARHTNRMLRCRLDPLLGQLRVHRSHRVVRPQ